VTHGGQEKLVQDFGGGWWCLKERAQFEDLVVDEKIILKYTFKEWGRATRTALLWPRIGKRGGLL
jgi:hypothetical protein